MAEEAKIAPAEESSKTEPAKSEAAEKTEKVAPKEETVGEVLAPKIPKESDETVPLKAFLEIKRSNKELAKEMKELKKSIEEGATKKEVSSDLKALAEKHNVDQEFLQEFADTVRQQTEQDVEGKITEKMRPAEERDRAERIDKIFTEHFSKALEAMPEYKDVVKPGVIKTLSLDPSNASKTFTQLIEESYGHLIQGKRSIDSASSRAGKNDNLEIDAKRMDRDTAYFKEVMSNPTLKKQWNDSLVDRVSKYL